MPETLHVTAQLDPDTFAADTERRTITGRVVAWDVQSSDARRATFAPGSITPREPLRSVKLIIEHDPERPVGYMTDWDGATGTARFKIADTPRGQAALEEAGAGVRDGLSVGVNVPEGGYSYDPDAGTLRITSAELLEVSLVAVPAFTGAGVTTVTATTERNPMTTPLPAHEAIAEQHAPVPAPTSADFAAFRAEVTAAVERQVAAALPAAGEPAPTIPSYASFGAFVRDLHHGAPAASELLAFAFDTNRDATMAKLAERNTWIGSMIRLIEARRPIHDLFGVEPLAEKGMTLEYGQLKTNSVEHAEQKKEGAALPLGTIELQNKTAQVHTIGGASLVSRQVIDRGSDEYLSTLYRAHGIAYAKQSEAMVRKVFDDHAKTTAGTSPITIAKNANADTWLDMLLDASELYTDRGFALDGLLLSKALFKAIMKLKDGEHRLMQVHGTSVNQVGEVTIRQASGTIASIPVRLLPNAEDNTAVFYDREALTIWESQGTPLRLSATDPLTLHEAFSVYGYQAAGITLPEGLVAVNVTG